VKDLRGKRALVTGAASGIGRAIARELARHGTHLWLMDINAAGLAETATEVEGDGVEIVQDRCDLAQAADVTRCIAVLLETWPDIDLLINNAGVVYYGPTENMTVAQWQWLMNINLLAPIRITHQLLPTLLARPESHILNMCSIAGLVAGGGRSTAYQVSKFGLVGFTESLRAEFGRRGIGVTALCPGPVRTNLYRAGISGRPGRSVPEPPRWLCASETSVAKRAIRSIRHNHRLVLVTPMAHVLWNTKRFAPWLLDLASQWGRGRRLKQKRVGEPTLTIAPTVATQCANPPERRRRAA
jgi:short-subunit dehydrogenase